VCWGAQTGLGGGRWRAVGGGLICRGRRLHHTFGKRHPPRKSESLIVAGIVFPGRSTTLVSPLVHCSRVLKGALSASNDPFDGRCTRTYCHSNVYLRAHRTRRLTFRPSHCHDSAEPVDLGPIDNNRHSGYTKTRTHWYSWKLRESQAQPWHKRRTPACLYNLFVIGWIAEPHREEQSLAEAISMHEPTLRQRYSSTASFHTMCEGLAFGAGMDVKS
jgi:hypothetical protein